MSERIVKFGHNARTKCTGIFARGEEMGEGRFFEAEVGLENFLEHALRGPCSCRKEAAYRMCAVVEKAHYLLVVGGWVSEEMEVVVHDLRFLAGGGLAVAFRMQLTGRVTTEVVIE